MASVAKREWTHKGETKVAWVVRYTDQGGKRRMKTFDRKKDADRYRTKVESEIEGGTHVADNETVTVSAALDLWLTNCDDRVRANDRIRARTVRNFRSWVENHIRPQLGSRLLTELSYRMLQDWVDRLAFDKTRPRSHDTIKNVVVCLRLALKRAHRKGLVGRNLLRDHVMHIPGRKNQRVEVPTKAEVRQYLNLSGTCLGMGGVARYLRPLLYTAVFTGLRQGELRALTWENVDFEKGLIRVRVSADNVGHVHGPKTEAGVRDVPIAPHLAIELKKWKLASRQNEANLVFTGNRGRMVQQACIQQSWHRLQRRAANSGKGQTPLPHERYHFHALRHVCASLWIEAGLPAKRIQYLMGHSSIQMTFDTYGHLFEDPGAVHAAMTKIGAELIG
ncbi:tyrosine-type recombinase/integrase [Methylorubrum extorquens]